MQEGKHPFVALLEGLEALRTFVLCAILLVIGIAYAAVGNTPGRIIGGVLIAALSFYWVPRVRRFARRKSGHF